MGQFILLIHSDMHNPVSGVWKIARGCHQLQKHNIQYSQQYVHIHTLQCPFKNHFINYCLQRPYSIVIDTSHHPIHIVVEIHLKLKVPITRRRSGVLFKYDLHQHF